MVQPRELARIAKALSVETRVRIVQLLRDGPLCVGALAAQLHVTQGAVSQHLRLLRDAGLVEAERRGYYVHYRLNDRTVAKWRRAIDGLLVTRRPKGKERAACVARRKAVRSRRS